MKKIISILIIISLLTITSLARPQKYGLLDNEDIDTSYIFPEFLCSKVYNEGEIESEFTQVVFNGNISYIGDGCSTREIGFDGKRLLLDFNRGEYFVVELKEEYQGGGGGYNQIVETPKESIRNIKNNFINYKILNIIGIIAIIIVIMIFIIIKVIDKRKEE